MKKYVAMIALSLAIAGTSQAQNAPQRNNSSNNRYGQEQRDKNDKSDYQRDDDRQANISPAQRATQRTEMLSQKLDLSSKQQKKLQALNLKQAQQMENLDRQYANSNGRNEQQNREMQRLRNNWEKEFKSIVSKKQYAQYEQERQQMQARRGDQSNNAGNQNTRIRRPYNG